MDHIDPATWTQLIIAAATLFTAIGGWVRSQSNSKKIDRNTDLTTEIHTVTNGPMAAKLQNISTQADTNAAEARSTAEAAKVQAAVDAKAAGAPPHPPKETP
jgi:hypothetical protein